jgi:glucose-fructose oxidoreductase
MITLRLLTFLCCAIVPAIPAPVESPLPLRLAIVGLAHGHVLGFLRGSALVPAGGAARRPDIEIIAVVDPSRDLFDKYAKEFHFPPEMYFSTVEDMASHVHPQAALVFTSTFDHTKAVEDCARHGIHVMMEKPMAVSYKDALAIADASRRGHIHVLVDYETTWYASNKAAHDLVEKGTLGDLRKVVVRDGHRGPKLIGVQPEFFAWLTDPKLNGAGALYDFGCYGADLMTWLMHDQQPLSVTAVTQQQQPEVYPKVDDEADMFLKYQNTIAIVQGSWNWPFDVKNMDVFGRTGYAKTITRDDIEIRQQGAREAEVERAEPVPAPYDDPLHFLTAVIRGQASEEGTLSSLKTNMIVSEILDAARRSAQTGQTVKLPLTD